MIKADFFKLSGRQQAIRPESFTIENQPIRRADGSTVDYWRCQIDAVWYRRRKGITVACWGLLENSQTERPADVFSWLQSLKDGRYGPTCRVRWDGDTLWTLHTTHAETVLTDVLRPMLRAINITRAHAGTKPPAGWDGWWTWGEDES